MACSDLGAIPGSCSNVGNYLGCHNSDVLHVSRTVAINIKVAGICKASKTASLKGNKGGITRSQ